MAQTMTEFRSLLNVDAGNGKRALKAFVKHLVKSCQKRGQEVLMIQTADRACTNMVIARDLRCIPSSKEHNQMPYGLNVIGGGADITPKPGFPKKMLFELILDSQNYEPRQKDSSTSEEEETHILAKPPPAEPVKP